MFRGAQPNSYDEIVAKTTDENLTGENWELILNLCDKVQDEGEQGARNVIAALLKRLAHRNANVQLYTLTLAEALTKNCGIEVHREISSRAFTQGLEKLITDRTTHERVKRRALGLIALWASEFEKDPTLGIMEECYESLKGKGYKFETPDEPPPPQVDDEVRRREEEELQRALEMSMRDKGGRGQWDAYSLASSSGAGGSGVGVTSGQPAVSTPTPQQKQTYPQQTSYGGYVPSANPAVSTDSSPSTVTTTTMSTSSPAPSASSHEGTPIVTRVRALHTFEPSEAGELAFEKGDIIKVVDRGYKDWWRGQLKGRTGIFPVNYVEPLPEPTAAELAKEAEQEAAVFNQAANVDRLLTLLRGMDPAKDNLADNEEIQELYRNCMTLRPKIVKLIDKYSQKRADLVSMNETFVKARTIFDRMMEESLARHTAMYDGRPPYPQTQSYVVRPDSRSRQGYGAPGAPQQYGWNPAVYEQPGYNAYPAAAPAYSRGPEGAYPAAAPPQAYSDPSAYGPRYTSPQGYGTPSPYTAQPEPQGYPSARPGSQPHLQAALQSHRQPEPAQQASVQPQSQPQSQSQPQTQPHPHPQTQPQPQPQPQPQQQQQVAQRSGPPYDFDPSTTYADPNVQAWAQYYAQGGTDPTGSVYFISIPGLKEGPPGSAPPTRTNSQDTVQATPQQSQPQTQQGATALGHSANSPHQAYAMPEAAVAQQSNPELNNFATQQPQAEQNAQAVAAPVSQQPYNGFEANSMQHHGGQAPSSPTASVHTPQPGYGVSPYGSIGYAAQGPAGASEESFSQPPAAQPPHSGWHAQYHGLPNQLAGMEVSGEDVQGTHPGAQGVGAPT